MELPASFPTGLQDAQLTNIPAIAPHDVPFFSRTEGLLSCYMGYELLGTETEPT